MLDGNLKALMAEMLRTIRLDIRKQYAFPVKARVLAVYLEANQYFADVQPLRNNLDAWEVEQEDGTKRKMPSIKKVRINTITNGSSRGFFAIPAIDKIVRVSFWNGDWNWPFIDAVLWDETPQLDEKEVAVYRDADTSIRLRENGDIEIRSKAKVYVEAADVEVKADTVVIESGSIDLAGDGGPAVARIGDQVRVGDSTGEITSGSSKVRAN